MNAVDILKYGHLTLLQALEGLPESEWTTPGACGPFSTKDLMVHLTSPEEVLADVLQSFGAGGSTPHFDLYGANPDEYGRGREARAATMSPAEVLADYHAAHDRLMDNVQAVPAETLRQVGTIPWYGAEYTLDDLIVYFNYGHKREHSGQMGLFRDRFQGQSGG
jgi:hypothetical protein